ncbi:hypothetical protein EJ110_NYTH21238 [Nymphaea thermarum]|nr:hypothetical protein EJ110_NYTH21238 [Nymphaea thermarum]
MVDLMIRISNTDGNLMVVTSQGGAMALAGPYPGFAACRPTDRAVPVSSASCLDGLLGWPVTPTLALSLDLPNWVAGVAAGFERHLCQND